ncbi:DUF4192 family protein [Agrococcus sp. Ld7]|uniref:DUF4192 family protein n=1 Tax=Agrococcus sp. Ld7 TaxID=649148 RepID=UPI00386E3EA0
MDTVRIRTPQSLLRVLPRLVGPLAPPSLVVLPFTAGRSGMPMMLDLPGPRDVAVTANTILTAMQGGEAVVLIACLGAPLGAGPLPLRSELRRVCERLGSCGVVTLDLLALAPDAWGDYAHPDGARGPRAELDLLEDPLPGVPLPASIPGVPGDEDGAAMRAVAERLEHLEPEVLDTARADPIAALERAVALAAHLEAGSETGDAAATKTAAAAATAAAIASALVESPAMRDLAIELAIDGEDAAARTLAAIERGTPLAVDAAATRFLGMGPAPQAAVLHDRLRRWTTIAAAVPLESRAPLLVIVGFLQFFVGRGRTAGRCAELAMVIDPSLTMAPLLRDIVDARGAPDWVLTQRREVPSRHDD